MNEVTQQLDASGLSCPLPVLRTKKAIASLSSGDVLEIISSDPGSAKDLESFCNQTGHTLLSSREDENRFIFQIAVA